MPTAEQIRRLELDEAREALEFARQIEPSDSKIPTIPCPTSFDEAVENMPESTRLFVLADVAPKGLAQ